MNGVGSGFCTVPPYSPVQLEGRPLCSWNACAVQLECKPCAARMQAQCSWNAGPVQLEYRPSAANPGATTTLARGGFLLQMVGFYSRRGVSTPNVVL